MAETTKEPKRKRARRNYQKELERVTFYLETIIRIKAQPPMEGVPEMLEAERKGELRAYNDALSYINER